MMHEHARFAIGRASEMLGRQTPLAVDTDTLQRILERRHQREETKS